MHGRLQRRTGTKLMASTASADEWPTKDIHLVVPYAPGGTTDVLSRRVADLLSQELGANVIVENRPGAGSTVGTGRVARGGRDIDHTLLMASPGQHYRRRDLPWPDL